MVDAGLNVTLDIEFVVLLKILVPEPTTPGNTYGVVLHELELSVALYRSTNPCSF